MRRPALFVVSLAFAVSALAQSRLDVLRSDAQASRFEQAVRMRNFQFPLDHGPHAGFRHEWWYFTGHLQAGDGQRFGFELTFFRYALAPKSSTQSSLRGPWRARQVYMAHFAVTDPGRKVFHFSERHSREALGLAGAEAQPLRVWLEDWSLTESPSGWTLSAAADPYALDLHMQLSSEPVLNGEAGLSRKSAERGAASYYYSIPRLSVSGRLTREGEEIPVEGTAWLDREWGSGALGADQQGWDWFALQLDDGSSFMFYALRRRDGSRDPFSGGTWIGRDGRARTLRNNEVQIEVRRYWRSPRGGQYPAAWQVRVPSLSLDLEVRPWLADQELATTPRYWEGAVSLVGRHEERKASGQGYVELVGYAD